jgi:hypothetical protein
MTFSWTGWSVATLVETLPIRFTPKTATGGVLPGKTTVVI